LNWRQVVVATLPDMVSTAYCEYYIMITIYCEKALGLEGVDFL
jgi:hypothetical protein